MMGKTHLFIGAASALACAAPYTKEGCLAAIIGGTVGGIISDIDIKSKPTKMMALGIVAVSLLVDWIVDGGILAYMRNCNRENLLIGICLFMILCVIGAFQDHREFTHSLFALCLFSFSVGLFCRPVFPAFAVGFASHILLDILNKKPLRLFFPSQKGVCLRLCYADKTADKIFLTLGMLGTGICLAYAVSTIVYPMVSPMLPF